MKRKSLQELETEYRGLPNGTNNRAELVFQYILGQWGLKKAMGFFRDYRDGPARHIGRSPILQEYTQGLEKFRQRWDKLGVDDDTIGTLYAINYIMSYRIPRILLLATSLGAPLGYGYYSWDQGKQEAARIVWENQQYCNRIIAASCETNLPNRKIYLQLKPMNKGGEVLDGTEMYATYFERSDDGICYELENAYSVWDAYKTSSKGSYNYRMLGTQIALPSSVRWNESYGKCTYQ